MVLTRYAVCGFEFGEEFLGVAPLSSLGLLQALADAFSSIGAGSDIEQALIGSRILQDGFSLAFDGEHDGPLVLLELFHEIARAAVESGQRLSVFRDIKHRGPTTIKALFQVLSEAVGHDGTMMAALSSSSPDADHVFGRNEARPGVFGAGIARQRLHAAGEHLLDQFPIHLAGACVDRVLGMDSDHLARITPGHPGLRGGFISADHAIRWVVCRAGEQRGGGSDLQEDSSIHGGECIPRFSPWSNRARAGRKINLYSTRSNRGRLVYTTWHRGGKNGKSRSTLTKKDTSMKLLMGTLLMMALCAGTPLDRKSVV